MISLSVNHILALHSLLIKRTGGTDGVRDRNMLELAVNSPFMSFDGVDLYPSIYSKAAQLAFSLISNHPFVDGNKRVGMLALLTFLELNGIKTNFDDDDIIRMGISVAKGEMNSEDIAEIIITKSKICQA